MYILQKGTFLGCKKKGHKGAISGLQGHKKKNWDEKDLQLDPCHGAIGRAE